MSKIFHFSLKSDDNTEQLELINTFFLMCWSFILLFLFCEGGEQLTGEYNQFDEALCQCKWYLFPMDAQKMLLIFMPNSQQPLLIQSYGNLVCARNSFKTVDKKKLHSFCTFALHQATPPSLNFLFLFGCRQFMGDFPIS